MKSYQLALVLVGLVLGFMLTAQYRVTREIQSNEPVQRTKQLSTQLDKVSAGPQVSEIKEALEHARIEAGVIEVSGPGVEVILNDSNIALKPGQNPNLYVLHDEDILRVLNELRAAGAEAVSINGQRLLATTEVRCTGPTILLNKNKRLAPPYVITAIGNPDTLESSLKMKGGVAETLQFWGIQVAAKR